MKNTSTKTLKLLVFISFFVAVQSLFAQNPKVVNGVATYTANKNIGPKFPVEDYWDKIVIGENVTITGSFYMGNRSKAIEICGVNRKTSILQGDGSRPIDDFNAQGDSLKGRSYSAIRCDGSPDVYVHDMTITKPMKFHIHGGFGNVTVERCDIIAGSETHTTDGIHGGAGKTTVKDCYINVFDDALYTLECKLVENTTIMHNKNGGPFMTGWGADVPVGHVCVIKNCKVIANYAASDYNHGVVSWAGKHSESSVKETITLKFEGTFEYVVPTGKKASTFYTIGRTGNTGVKNAHIVIDGQCPYKSSIDLRESTNCSVTFKNCPSTSTTTRFEAESYSSMSGVQKETTTDAGAGSNVAYINNNDWCDYSFNVKTAGTYTTKFRVASLQNGGTIQILKGSTVLGSVEVAPTGGWQTWTTINGPSIKLSSTGTQTIRLKFVNSSSTGSLFNLNWFDVIGAGATKSAILSAEELGETSASFDLYPNPADGQFIIDLSGAENSSVVEVYNLQGSLVYSQISEPAKLEVNTANWKSGLYFVKVKSEGTLIVKKLVVK